jgi:hypothetical protein
MARYDDIRKPNVVEVDDKGSYRRRWKVRGSLVFILILALVAIRLYQNRGSEAFGKRINAGEAEPRTTPPIEIKTAPVDPPVVAVEEPPRVAAEPPRVAAEPPRVAAKPPRVAAKPPRVAAKPLRVAAKLLRVAAKPLRVATRPRRVAVEPPMVAVEPHRVATRPRRVAVEPPMVAVERRPALTTELQSDIMGYARIIAENANLRARPGVQYRLISVLPRNREVAVLRQLHINTNGEAWVEVLAATDQGWRKGWVMRRFLDSCNCPTY